ncbi:MAG: PIN domain-containing protein [Thermodesulfovibrionales bacterium]
MVLVDTSVWVAHLREGKIGLDDLLNNGLAVCHPCIIGELACGNLKNRSVILSLLQTLPAAVQAEHEDVMTFLERYRLMGKGLGYVDMHLLVSAVLSNISLWTLDKRLHEVSKILKKAY